MPTMKPRAILLIPALLAVAALTLLTNSATRAQSEAGATLPAPALTATPGEGAVALTWNAVAGAVRYELWTWTTAGGWQQLDDGALTGTSFTHGELTAGATYH